MNFLFVFIPRSLPPNSRFSLEKFARLTFFIWYGIIVKLIFFGERLYLKKEVAMNYSDLRENVLKQYAKYAQDIMELTKMAQKNDIINPK